MITADETSSTGLIKDNAEQSTWQLHTKATAYLEQQYKRFGPVDIKGRACVVRAAVPTLFSSLDPLFWSFLLP